MPNGQSKKQKRSNRNSRKLLQLFNAISTKAYHLEILGKIKQASLINQSPAEFSCSVLAEMDQLIDYSYGSILIFDKSNECGVLLAEKEDGHIKLLPKCEIGISQDQLKEIQDLNPGNRLDTFESIAPISNIVALLNIPQEFHHLSLLLYSHAEIVGILNIGCKNTDFFSAQDIALAKDVADSLAVAIQKSLLFNETQKRTQELEFLFDVSEKLRRATDRSEIYSILTTHIRKMLHPCFCTYIWEEDNILWNQQNDFTKSEFSLHLREMLRSFECLTDEIEHRFFGTDAKIFQDIFQVPLLFAFVLPINVSGSFHGKLVIGFYEERDLRKEEYNLLLSTADIVGNALNRSIMLNELEKRVNQRTKELETLYHIKKSINN